MANNLSEIEKRLWESADQLRANSNLKSSEYSVPVLGLIFSALRRSQVLHRRAGTGGQGVGAAKDRQGGLSSPRRDVSPARGSLLKTA